MVGSRGGRLRTSILQLREESRKPLMGLKGILYIGV